MIKGLVSCVIPSYKRCDTVTRAIDSVLAQTYKDIEVCLVDDNVPGDAYSEKLQEALEKYKGDNRVRYIAQEKHINGAVARNIGIKAASGEYVAFLDDDDEWHPQKIEKQVALLKQNGNKGGVSCLYSLASNGVCRRKCPPYSSDNLQYKILARQVAIYTSTFLCVKEALINSGAFNESLVRHQDLQMFADFLRNNTIFVLNEYCVTIHTDSSINRPDTDKLISVKKKFFESVSSCLIRYSKKEKKLISSAHYFEIVFSAVKEKKYTTVLKYLLKIGISPLSYYDLYLRYTKRKYNK